MHSFDLLIMKKWPSHDVSKIWGLGARKIRILACKYEFKNEKIHGFRSTPYIQFNLTKVQLAAQNTYLIINYYEANIIIDPFRSQFWANVRLRDPSFCR